MQNKVIEKRIDMSILACKFIGSALLAFVLSDTSHKLLPYIIVLLLIIIGLKATKKVWND
jgi:uncharacterized membrane protein YfcA